MLQLKSLALYCALLVILVSHCQGAENETNIDCPPDDGDDDRDELCKDFQILRDLIDADVLADLIQSHYQCDSKFRKAMCYYNTSRFQLVIEQLQQSEAFLTLLEELRNAGVNTKDIDNIDAIFNCITLPVPPTDKKCNCKELRGHTFIGDVLAAMPHQAVRQYMYSSRIQKSNFALFRETVISPDFQTKLRSNMLKSDAVRALHVLRRNGWDIPELLRGAMTMLSW